ncbi:MAG: hypothetical protein JW771_06845 [Candidatus Thermoplasmatota archaeon]|nr:hypothetical protein [Candidatus Thermoplasmatota archaeon]
MRRARKSAGTHSTSWTLYLIGISIVLTLCSSTVPADSEGELIFDVVPEVYENDAFIVSVYTYNETGTLQFLLDVTVEFDGEIYQITDDSAEKTIQAPAVLEDTEMNITASKIGYVSNTTTILVRNKGQLTVTPDDYIVEKNKPFSVAVTDDQGTAIAGAIVAIQGYAGEGSSTVTKANGRATLTAPENREELVIRAEKEGYFPGTETIELQSYPSLFEIILGSEYTLIGVAIALLLASIVIVHFRQKKTEYLKQNEQSTKPVSRSTAHGTIVSPPSNEETVQVEPKRGAKVEEIRISRPRKDKEIFAVKPVDKELEKRKPELPDEDKWFEGTDRVRYEIDRLTGEIDEEGKDKWFEGIDDIRAKIDEKVKKKDKKDEDGK